ncbi:hypothetical protein HDF25_000938 [Pedobacter cryoconitis]|uniref:Uncharacterized protein n=1 Tax=Pedobacter cryoconitis TaxID=188932 RepID=A0A7X0J0G3_9SPHI|nr:hypothetical protein [Pedobacter cryoconitis]
MSINLVRVENHYHPDYFPVLSLIREEFMVRLAGNSNVTPVDTMGCNILMEPV